jgi:hypothetical protein
MAAGALAFAAAPLTAAVPAALLAPAAAAARDFGLGRPGIARRPGADEALRRTVSVVLRAEARSNGLPDFMTDPTPLTEEEAASLTLGGPVPDTLAVQPAPEGVDRRLPHARGGSIWVAAGTWMLEVDPTRNRILAIAHDVLPPEL